MRCRWVGLMPPQTFVDTFLPRTDDSPAAPELPRDAFSSSVAFKKERDMYGSFIDAVHEYNLIPGFKFVDTSDFEDFGSTNIREIKPYPTMYKSSVNTEQQHMQWDKAELNAEFKLNDCDDPFCNPGISTSTMTEEEKERIGFMSNSASRQACLGQLAIYAAEWLGRQHRCFGFTIFIIDPYIRFIRWDRAGAIVSERFEFRTNCHILADFLWSFAHSDDAQRGIDTTVRDPSDDEASLARDLLQEHQKPKKRPIKVFSVPQANGEFRDFIGWHPIAEPWSLTGRCTRAYPVVDPTTRKVMFLKDVWRAVELEKESEILKKLKAKSVSYTPQLVCGDDITLHSTQTDRFLPGGDLEDDWVLDICSADVTPRIHNRLVVDVVCRPLSKFTSSKEMFRAVYHAFIAHKEAYQLCGLLHGDISMANIMINDEGNGVLIDWDLARDINDSAGPRQHERTGTWPFMSVLLLENREKFHTIQDDMESFFYVVLYTALRYLHHNMLPNLRSILEEIFEYTILGADGHARGGKGKICFLLVDLPLVGFQLTSNESLQEWIWKVKGWINEWISTARSPHTKGDKALLLSDYAALEKSFMEALEKEWPENDPAKDMLPEVPKPVLRLPHRDQACARRAKRSLALSTDDKDNSATKKGKH